MLRSPLFVVPLTVVIWSRSFGHFRFRKRGHYSLYINIKYLYYSGGFDSIRFRFWQMTKWPNDQRVPAGRAENSLQDLPEAPEHPLDLWSLLQSVATKRTERKKASKLERKIFLPKYSWTAMRMLYLCNAFEMHDRGTESDALEGQKYGTWRPKVTDFTAGSRKHKNQPKTKPNKTTQKPN